MAPKPTREELIEAALGYIRAWESDVPTGSHSTVLRTAFPEKGTVWNAAGCVLADAYEQEKQQRKISEGLLEDWIREAEETRYGVSGGGCYPLVGSFLVAAALLTGILIGHYWK